jgi:hypothetical protein
LGAKDVDREIALDQAERRLTDDDRVGLGTILEPGGDVGGIAQGQMLVMAAGSQAATPA